jgi:DNA transformation protein
MRKPSPAPADAEQGEPAPAALPNLGPVSTAMLARAGITSLDALRALGAVETYRRVRRQSPRASLNLLWALEGALTQRPWQVAAREDRLSLLLQLDADPRHPGRR